MNIDEIMKMISLKDTGYAHNPAEMKLAIEQYAEAKRESMRQACMKACEDERISDPHEDCGYPYNRALSDVVAAMLEIK